MDFPLCFDSILDRKMVFCHGEKISVKTGKKGVGMIEIIYKDEPQKKTGEPAIKVPKNIRQIGTDGDNCKIYIEDYAMTYLKRNNTKERMSAYGILTGKQTTSNGVTYTFISGLICGGEQESLPVFTDAVWKKLQKEKQTYFPDSEIVGWYIDLPYNSNSTQLDLLRLHVEQFGKGDKLCYIKDRQEGENGFYKCENGILKKQSGYAVYFEKNENLEKYFLAHQVDLKNTEEAEKSRQVGGTFRTVMRQHAENAAWNRRIAQIGGAVAVLTLIITATTVFKQNVTIEDLTNSVSKLTAQVKGENGGEKDVVVEAVKGEVTPQESTTAEEKETTKKEETTTPQDTPEETKQVDSKASYYTVKEGETLFQICMKIYNDANMLEALRAANNIDSSYSIYEGQKLILP